MHFFLNSLRSSAGRKVLHATSVNVKRKEYALRNKKKIACTHSDLFGLLMTEDSSSAQHRLSSAYRKPKCHLRFFPRRKVPLRPTADRRGATSEIYAFGLPVFEFAQNTVPVLKKNPHFLDDFQLASHI
jgi:hypothetical protein